LTTTPEKKKPTDQLKDEHAGITVMLQILNFICEQSEFAAKLYLNEFDRILEFFTVFVDRCHHGKEEDLLFPALERAGIARQAGLIGILLEEHDRGRAYVRAMQRHFEAYRSGDIKSLSGIIMNARNVIDMLVKHIKKEDTELYPIADRVLGPEAQEELSTGFDAIERDRVGQGRHEAFHALMAQLKKKYNIGTIKHEAENAFPN